MTLHPSPIRSLIDPLEPRRLLSNAMIRDIGAGELHANPSELTVIGQTVYFVASADAPGSGSFWELWRTEGTKASTRRIVALDGAEPGSSLAWESSRAPGLAFYTGPRSLLSIGEDLWFYEVRHTSAQILTATLNRLAPDGTRSTWDLGTLNLSLRQTLNDPINVDGQIYFYRNGDEFSLDPELQRSAWWTIDESGELVSTGQRRADAFSGKGPDYANSALLRDQRLSVRDNGTHGRELWIADNPTVINGVLSVFGSEASDDILLARRANKTSYLDVRVNGFLKTFRFGSVRKIQIDLLGGDDRAIIDETVGGAIARPVSMFGGLGNDTLQGGSARDTIYGGAGDDALYGGGERDHLFGEHGDDRLLGGGGSDILWGGADHDTFVRSSRTERRDYRDGEDRAV